MIAINRKNTASIVLYSIAYIFVCCPLFGMTGNIIAPVTIGLLLGAVIGGCATELNSQAFVGFSQVVFVSFWILFALIKEFFIQLMYQLIMINYCLA